MSFLSKLLRATRREPCPICGAKKYCGFSEDGAIAICMDVAAGAASQTKNGGYLHFLREREQPINFQPKAPRRELADAPLATIEHRHAVFTALLESLVLYQRHADNLLARGLSDTEAARNFYASRPDEMRAAAVCADLPSRFDLTGVPGFFRDKRECWQLVTPPSGFYVPARDVRGRIQALQVRFDQGKPRYKWLSSKDRPGGASSGAPIHFARPWRCGSTGEVVITEGALKADIIAEQLDVCVVAVAGAGSFRDDFGQWLRIELPDLRSVLIALDSDWHEKPDVERAMLRLMQAVEDAELTGGMLDWGEAKGMDDLLNQEVAA